MQKETARQDWIDLTRLVAILIVMMNHAGLKVRGVNFWGGMFYVPVFFVLSGFFFKARRGTFLSSAKKRAKRLLVPFFVTNLVLVLIFLLRDILRGSFEGTLLRTFGFLYGRNQLYEAGDTLMNWHTGKNVYFMTALNAPTWFLPALFVTVLCMELITRVGRDKTEQRDDLVRRQRYLLVICLLILFAQLWHYMVPVLLPWSIDAVSVFLLLYFEGYVLGQKGLWKKLTDRPWTFLILLLLIIGGGLLNGSANLSIGDYGKSMSLGVFNCVTACPVIMYVCYTLRGHIPSLLTTAGRKTLPLLCWHYPLLEAERALVEKLFRPEGILLPISKGLEILVAVVIICLADELFKKVFGVVFLKRKKERRNDTNEERRVDLCADQKEKEEPDKNPEGSEEQNGEKGDQS